MVLSMSKSFLKNARDLYSTYAAKITIRILLMATYRCKKGAQKDDLKNLGGSCVSAVAEEASVPATVPHCNREECLR